MRNSVFAKCGGAKKVVNGLSIFGESCLAISEHMTSVIIEPKSFTQVALCWLTVAAFLTFSCENRENMISWFELSHTLTYTLHNSEQQQYNQLVLVHAIKKLFTKPIRIFNCGLKREDLKTKKLYIPCSFMTKYARKQRLLPLQYKGTF